MLFLIGEILICLIIVFILGFLIGWLLKSALYKEKSAVSNKPARPEELEKVEGIGPKIASILIENGIMDLEDLSKTSVDTLNKILDQAGSQYNVADPSTWPEQAALGARGDWEAMEKLKEELQGGRR
jgi:hypothetical protein